MSFRFRPVQGDFNATTDKEYFIRDGGKSALAASAIPPNLSVYFVPVSVPTDLGMKVGRLEVNNLAGKNVLTIYAELAAEADIPIDDVIVEEIVKESEA